MKVASKFFGQKFACGASITGDDEIVIQGDFKDDLFDLIPEKWPEVEGCTSFAHKFAFKVFFCIYSRLMKISSRIWARRNAHRGHFEALVRAQYPTKPGSDGDQC